MWRPSVWWSLTDREELLDVIRLRSLWKTELKLKQFSVTKLFSGLVRFAEFIIHLSWGYANTKLVADIKIILYSFPGERIVILEAYRRRRLHLRHFLTDVKKQNPDVEFCLNEDKLVIDGRDVSYCEQTNAVCIQTQNDAPSRLAIVIEEHCVKKMNVIFFSSFSLLDTYRWRNQWRKLRSN